MTTPERTPQDAVNKGGTIKELLDLEIRHGLETRELQSSLKRANQTIKELQRPKYKHVAGCKTGTVLMVSASVLALVSIVFWMLGVWATYSLQGRYFGTAGVLDVTGFVFLIAGGILRDVHHDKCQS